MTDNEATVAVPVSLIERNMAAAGGQDWVKKWNVANELSALIPKPAPRRLRVVDLDAMPHDYSCRSHQGAKCDCTHADLEAAPDVLTLIEQQIENWDRGGRVTSTARLVSRIRTAIEEAPR